MQALADYDTFVELEDDHETYIAKRRRHCYAFVHWFPRNRGSQLEWRNDSPIMDILPVHRIKSRFTPIHMREDNIIFEVLPIPRHIRLAASYEHDS